jgi:hypothetical protein
MMDRKSPGRRDGHKLHVVELNDRGYGCGVY